MRSRRKTLAIDIDGVLAQFVPVYAALCSRHTGLQVPDVAHEWNWVRAAGVTEEQEAEVWRYIDANPAFWSMLPEEAGCREVLSLLDAASSYHAIYFLTHRPMSAKYWTEQWLKERGMETPTVVLTSEKGKVAHALNVDVAIDDKPSNCLDLYRHLTHEARVYMLAKPWNVPHQEEWGHEKPPQDGGIRVVNEVMAALEGL